jgi:hypothetical protein
MSFNCAIQELRAARPPGHGGILQICQGIERPEKQVAAAVVGDNAGV